MKKFLKFAAIAATAFALLSCEKDPQGGDTQKPDGGSTNTPTTEYTEDLKFTLEVAEVEADQAKIKVEHNGTTKDTWYGFATTESDVNKAIADVLAEGNVTLKKNTKTNVTVRNLEPETEYTFIAVGIKADGTQYGEPATVKFTTAKAEEPTPPTPTPGEYTINPNWTVTYIGDYEEGGQVYDNVVVVETTDTNPYFVTAWPVDYYEELGIEAIVAAEIEAWEEMLAQYPGATWADIVYSESILAQVGIDPEYGTRWYAMAIGCDTNGKATGLYALSEVIDLENLGGGNEDVELTPEYAAWLGDWTFTGANGVAFDVTMKQGKANQTYKLAGWEGPESEGLDIKVEWMADYGIWVIYAQSFGTFSFGASGNGEIWLTPESKDGYIYPAEGIPACMGGMTEDGQMVVEGYSEELEDGSVVEMATMMYLAKLEADGQYYGITSVKEWPTFPLTVTPATKATTYAVKEFKGGKKTLNPLAPKTFKTFSLCDMSVRTF